jgi:hypothetical protein
LGSEFAFRVPNKILGRSSKGTRHFRRQKSRRVTGFIHDGKIGLTVQA